MDGEATLRLKELKKKRWNLNRINDQTLRSDKDIVLAAVQHRGLGLKGAIRALRADKEVVLAAVKQDGRALQFADQALQSDTDVIMAAVTQNGSAFQFAAPSLRADKEVGMRVVMQNPAALRHADVTLLSDVDFVGAVLKKCPQDAFQGYQFLSITLLSGRSACFVLEREAYFLDYSSGGERAMCRLLLEQCADRFGLELESVLNNSELLDEATAARVGNDRTLFRLSDGRMHKLQLIVQLAAKRRKV